MVGTLSQNCATCFPGYSIMKKINNADSISCHKSTYPLWLSSGFLGILISTLSGKNFFRLSSVVSSARFFTNKVLASLSAKFCLPPGDLPDFSSPSLSLAFSTIRVVSPISLPFSAKAFSRSSGFSRST